MTASDVNTLGEVWSACTHNIYTTFRMIPSSTLLTAYRKGFFPMAIDGEIRWFSPRERGIIPLDGFHVSRRLGRVLRQGRFEVAVDRAFEGVVAACASRPDTDGTWIDAEIAESYAALHRAGFAHSVEAWQKGELVGGLYGVTLRGAFFGESMFHRATDASKVAVAWLVERLRARGYTLLDIQWVTPHLASLGAVAVHRTRYRALLADAMRQDCRFL